MSKWGPAARLIGTFIVGVYTGNWQFFAQQVAYEEARRKRNSTITSQRRQFNAAQKDRLEMLDLQPDAARTLCLGRVRTVEGVRRRWSSGTNDEVLTLVVSFAGHEIDAFETWYIDDSVVTLDGSGYVETTPWRKTVAVAAYESSTLNGSGGATVVLPHAPVGGSVTATWSNGSGESYDSGSCSVDVNGSTVTLSGGQAQASVQVNYTYNQVTNYVRIRPYLGTAAQNVGADLAAEYPGEITSADEFAGIALAVVDLTFSPDVFPQGVPSITAVLRGAKVYDPRTTTTVWTANPALHAQAYATWAGGLGLDLADVRAADIEDAADVCDVTTDFTLRKPDNTTSVVQLPRYRSGIVIASDADRRGAMNAIVGAMAGEWTIAGDELRLRAGTMASSVAAIDQAWLAFDGADSDEPVVTAAQALPREQRFNHVSGSCVDDAQRYQLLPYPAVRDAVLIAAKGEKRTEIDFDAVSHVAHAQHLASVAIRRAQAGLQVRMTCGPQADLLEVFDVVTLDLPDYGISAKTMEVMGVADNDTGVTQVLLREIAADIFTPLAELSGRDPAPDSSLRPPWDVATLSGLQVTSGTEGTLDGSVLVRCVVTWTAATDAYILSGGTVEVQYTRADEALPSGDWPSWVEGGSSARAVIAGLMAGRPYLFRARFVQQMPLVRGAWSNVLLHTMASAPAGGAGLSVLLVHAYQRAAAQPSTPSATVTVTFATGAVAGLNNGWQATIPTADGNPLWVTTATASGTGSTDTIASGEWVAATKMAQDGATGTPGSSAPWVRVTGDNYNACTIGGFCGRGVEFSTGYTHTAGTRGHTLIVYNPATDAITAGPTTYDTYASGTAGLVAAINAQADGRVVILYSNDATSRDAALRTALAACGSSMQDTWVSDRISHVFIGQKGEPAGTAYEAATNATTAAGVISQQAYYTTSGLVLNGAAGTAGTNTAVAFAFTRTPTPTTPTKPSANVTYTFATGGLSGLDNGWAAALPASGGAYRWVITAAASGAGTTDTIAPAEWSSPTLLAQDGLTGVFADSFETVGEWQQVAGNGELASVQVSDSVAGGRVLRMGDASGTDDVWALHRTLIPFDSQVLYRIRVRVRRPQGVGTFWAGVAGVAADGLTLVNAAGANDWTSQHYVTAGGVAPGTSWTVYTGYVRGLGTPTSMPYSSIAAPGPLHSSVRYMRPMLIGNYEAQTGITEVDYMTVEALTGTVAGLDSIGTDYIDPDAVTAVYTTTAAGPVTYSTIA